MYRTLSALVVAAFLTDTALGGVVSIFTDKAQFTAFNKAEGKFPKLTEDFEESNLAGIAGTAVLSPTLQGNIMNVDPAGLGFPKGLVSKNLIIQSNSLGLNAPMPSPGEGLAVVGPGSFLKGLPNSVVVGAAVSSTDSTDLIFTEPNHTGVGFDLVSIDLPGMVHITVFDKNNVEIHKEILTASLDKSFFGIWSPVTIGRINIGSTFTGGVPGVELVDNIQMWVPAPGALALFGLAGLCGTCRRRR